MQVDGEVAVADPVKVSTSGPRMSRRETYKANKNFMIRLPRCELTAYLFVRVGCAY